VIDELAGVVGPAEGVLLDFDGPVADLFPKGSGSRIADWAREPILRAGVGIPEPLASTGEHLGVLEFAAVHAPEALDQAEQAAVDGEIEAARTAPITPGAKEFLAACAEEGRPVVVVSNNAAAAIEFFLELHGLADQVGLVVGRPFARPELMKPHPALADQVFAHLAGPPGKCYMVGDSASDIEFSRRIGVRSIGFAKNATRGAELISAGADAITPDMSSLAHAVRRSSRS
jgi:HAD superfamily hydrolase (TIGR01509 family)